MALEVIERGEQLALGEIARGTEQHECIGGGLLGGGRFAPAPTTFGSGRFPKTGIGTGIATTGGPYKYHVVWSPDSKKLMWADKKMRLQYVDIATKQTKM